MEQSFKAYLAGQAPPGDFIIHYHIGDEFSGETEFWLHGNGTYRLQSTATQDRQLRTYDGQVEVAQVEQVIRGLEATKVWEVTHIRTKPGEDDPEASIALEIGRQSFKVVLWVSEIHHCPPFVKAQQILLSLIQHLSAGEVLETGQ